MGTRYQAILDYLKIKYHGADNQGGVIALLRRWQYTHAIIASPTATHYYWLAYLSKLPKLTKLRILCEKPLVTDSLQRLVSLHEDTKLDLTMTYQYKYVNILEEASKITHYNFYNHGKDGLAWDCIQLIGLTKYRIELKEDSPIWNMGLNGRDVLRDSIDESYIRFIRAWLDGSENQDFNWLVDLHKKTDYLQNKVKTDGKYHSLNWDPSKDK